MGPLIFRLSDTRRGRPLNFSGALGALQTGAHTRVVLAACGARGMDVGPERVSDAREVALLRRRTIVLIAQALVVASLMAALAAAAAR